MSDYTAIGGVSASLQTLLRDRMELPNGVARNELQVTVGPPRAKEDGDSFAVPGVNLFLYRVSENGYLKNQEIPGHGDPGAYGRPPLALDLYYLVTAYGDTSDGDFPNETRAHHLLGSAMRVLHDHRVITEQLKTINDQAGRDVLDPSLQGAFEQVKLSLDPVGLEDLSKVWTALTLPFRLSAAYMVSVVQIASRRPGHFPRPVGEPPAGGPRIRVLPFRGPRIDELRVRRPGDPPGSTRALAYARTGDTLVIRGRNLGGDAARVLLGPVDATGGIGDGPAHPDRIELTIPDDPALPPGPQLVKVLQDVLLGDPPQPHAGLTSNLAVFVLVPRADKVELEGAPGARSVRITGTQLVHPELESMTLVGDVTVRSGEYATAGPAAIVFPLPGTVGSGRHAVRVRVNGAESIDDRVLDVP
jgi:hypothetical protein